MDIRHFDVKPAVQNICLPYNAIKLLEKVKKYYFKYHIYF